MTTRQRKTSRPSTSLARPDATGPVYAIGDIHGHFNKLQALWSKIEEDYRALATHARADVIFLGDYVDRGPAGIKVLQFCHDLWKQPPSWCHPVFLIGNHELMLLEWLQGKSLGALIYWLDNGGDETLEELGISRTDAAVEGVKATAKKFPKHLATFVAEALTLWYRWERYLFVHAGIQPGVPLDQQDSEELVWIREEFLADPRDHGFVVIHGHTPNYGRPEVKQNRINLDTGAGVGGPLTAVRLGVGAPVFLSS